VSPEAARDLYGVVVDFGTLEVDEEATLARRAEVAREMEASRS
jgi:hypothetical protein